MDKGGEWGILVPFSRPEWLFSRQGGDDQGQGRAIAGRGPGHPHRGERKKSHTGREKDARITFSYGEGPFMAAQKEEKFLQCSFFRPPRDRFQELLTRRPEKTTLEKFFLLRHRDRRRQPQLRQRRRGCRRRSRRRGRGVPPYKTWVFFSCSVLEKWAFPIRE